MLGVGEAVFEFDGVFVAAAEKGDVFDAHFGGSFGVLGFLLGGR